MDNLIIQAKILERNGKTSGLARVTAPTVSKSTTPANTRSCLRHTEASISAYPHHSEHHICVQASETARRPTSSHSARQDFSHHRNQDPSSLQKLTSHILESRAQSQNIKHLGQPSEPASCPTTSRSSCQDLLRHQNEAASSLRQSTSHMESHAQSHNEHLARPLTAMPSRTARQTGAHRPLDHHFNPLDGPIAMSIDPPENRQSTSEPPVPSSSRLRDQPLRSGNLYTPLPPLATQSQQHRVLPSRPTSHRHRQTSRANDFAPGPSRSAHFGERVFLTVPYFHHSTHLRASVSLFLT